MQQPTEGRIVHYRLAEGEGNPETPGFSNGKDVHFAKIVGLVADSSGKVIGCNLTVFCDCGPVLNVTAVPQHAADRGAWFFPPVQQG